MADDATPEHSDTSADAGTDSPVENPRLTKKRMLAKRRLIERKKRDAATTLNDEDIAVVSIEIRVAGSRLLGTPRSANLAVTLPIDGDPTDPIMDTDTGDLPIDIGPHVDEDVIDGVIV